MTPRDPASKAWEISVAHDGTGTFRWLGPPTSEPRVLQVSRTSVETMGAAAFFVKRKACETHEKNIAQTGKKTLSLEGGLVASSCEFNYSDHEEVNAAANAFLALEQTIQIGEELARLHRFDRVGLDAEMDLLAESVKTGRALELVNIAPILESIVDDDRVMERVRRKATNLLAQAK